MLPCPAVAVRSLELLFALGALDTQGRLTDPVGRSMARLPVDPMFGKVLLASATMGCSIEVMQVRGKLLRGGGVHKLL